MEAFHQAAYPLRIDPKGEDNPTVLAVAKIDIKSRGLLRPGRLGSLLSLHPMPGCCSSLSPELGGAHLHELHTALGAEDGEIFDDRGFAHARLLGHIHCGQAHLRFPYNFQDLIFV